MEDTDLQDVLDQFLSTKEVAEHFERTVNDVQYAIKTGKLKAYRWGWFYMIHRNDIPKEWPTEKRG
jgi:hypothetical protein